MEAVLATQASLYWSKLGKWQLLITIPTLLTFFAILYFVGDKKLAALFAAVTPIVILLVVASVSYHHIHDTQVLISGFGAILVATLVAYAATLFVCALSQPFVAVITAIITILVAIFVATLVASEMKKHGIKKRAVWLSCATEFVIILLPVLLA
ncbi:MAG: hypothetical protein WCV69_01050 [Patescibacteria group bacterium]|jgi:hypothetical protein